MHHDFLDRYSRMESPVHRLPTLLKVAVALSLILLVLLIPIQIQVPFLLIAFALVTIAFLSKLPPGFLLKRILFFEPFILAIAGLALLQPGGRAKFFSMILKSTLSLVTVVLLSNTTPFSDLLRLLRRLHAPPVLVTMLALMYRYLFVLIDEVERMNRARRSRTFLRSRSRSWIVLSTVLGQLFLRSTERAERIYAAMSARGWR